MRKRKDNDQRAETERRLWKSFEQIKAEGRPTGPTAFAKENGINRSYLYEFHELAAAVAEYGRKTQPSVSRRGAGVTKTEAKKRDIDDRVRREHAQWAREMPELREQLTKATDTVRSQKEEIQALKDSRQRLMRAYELLLMLASEAGVSLMEMQKIQESLLLTTAPPAGQVIHASARFGSQ
ncbi:MAG: hypothetical protein M3416_02990 [Acidobacteriota bacterium]|nr:hypothetical protein [Acidobacteriota bacterium]